MKTIIFQCVNSKKVPSSASSDLTVLSFFRLINGDEAHQRGRRT